MKMFTIIAGVNGTGKSSFTGALKPQTSDLGVVIDVDKITATHSLTALASGKIAVNRIRECLETGINFTQETTLASRQIVRTASQARESGYYVRMYYIGLNTPDESLRRIANRVARGGHNIGADDVLRRFSGRWEAVKNILAYCDEAHFFDNDNGFVEVAEYRNGELLIKGEYRPAWILELREFLENNL